MDVLFACFPDIPAPFPAGFATAPNATALLELREGGRNTKGIATYDSADCLELHFVNSCIGTVVQPYIAGKFELWTGACPNTGGRPAYYNSPTEMFLFYYSPIGDWAVATECGIATSGVLVYGGAGWFPFEDTAANWQCATNAGTTVPRPVAIECSFYEGQSIPCVSGTYDSSGEAPYGACSNSCPPELPSSSPGGTSVDDCLPPPEDCLEVKFVDSCTDTTSVSDMVSSFELWEGECADTGGGRPVYFNPISEVYLFYHSIEIGWFVGGMCGLTSSVVAYGGAGLYPFEDTAAAWQCADEGMFVTGSVSIECSFFDGQSLPCSQGEYEPAGEAPGGDCANSCPPHLPFSLPGSTSLSSCFSASANFLLVSSSDERLFEFNSDSSNFGSVMEGGDLRAPWEVACVSEIMCLVTNEKSGEVVAVNLRNEVMGVFAQVGNPVGLLHITHLDLLAVAWGDKVSLFDLADLDLEQPLGVSLPPSLPPPVPQLTLCLLCRNTTPSRRSSCRRQTAAPTSSASENTNRSCSSQPAAARCSAAASRARSAIRKSGTP
jgi:hypothetical protein